MSDKIIVPTLGESVTEATVSKWLKNQGEKVSADEPIVELETDKVNVEVPAPSNGVLENISVDQEENLSCRKIEIPVCCHENLSLDIERLEKKLKLSRDKIFENFFSNEYYCYMTGFIAGMPFLGDLKDEMRVERLETPRVKVPKGSVGVTEQFTNIYTFESPGGWNIIGNTPIKIFDNKKEKDPNLVNPGDTIIFKNINIEQYKNLNE